MSDLNNRLNQLLERVDVIRGVFDLPGKAETVAALEAESVASDFWDDAQLAQHKMQDLNHLQSQVNAWNELRRRAVDALELYAMAEDDPDLLAELESESNALAAELEKREFDLALGGKYDRGGAIISIHAGAGGTEAQDWAEMLLRMYLRWAEKKGYKTEITDMTQGEEAGVKSATIEVYGEYAYGYLRAEKGTHRLVRISPFDSGARRHTSFAKLEVMPIIDDDIEIEINPSDIRIDVFLSSGAGGQSVQKNATAVRLFHEPSGIVVTCQNERSQGQNRELALKILRGKLYEIEQEKIAEERARVKGENVHADFGTQIRSYVLHPYQMVKDLRTDAETGNPSAVLDGDLDMFINAWLKTQVGEE
ncbi:MAG: peptide chain release factor 2 [Caldilineaceae bacterium]|nr:peptide chain release factor 2 [Caldilineaceae bacterium]